VSRQKSIVAIVLCALFAPGTLAQRLPEFRLHDRGELWETMKDNGLIGAPNPTNRYEFYPSMDWPGGPHTLVSKDEQRSYSVGSGMWIGGKKGGGEIFFTENGPFTFVDNGTFLPITKQTNYAGTPSYNPDEAEEVITAEWVTTENVRVKRVSRGWSFPAYNTFLLIEYQLTNQSGNPLTDVYVGFPALVRPSYQDFVVHNGWGDDLNRADDYVRYDSASRTLYAYDDSVVSLASDRGNYWGPANELRTPGYAGIALIDADAATGGAPQPANVFYAQLLGNEQNFTLVSRTPSQMYALLAGADRTLQAPPDLHLSPMMLMSCGPYAIPAGGTVKIVLAHAVNGLPLSIATQGISAQAVLPAGLDSLKATIRRAQSAYARGYALQTIPPPAPAVTVVSLPSSRAIVLTWPPLEPDYVNPRTGKSDLSRYRIYRANRSFIGPYAMIREIKIWDPNQQAVFFNQKLGVWRYIDQSISLGVSYFYAVTSLDSTGREAGLTNRNETAVKSSAPPADNASQVIVFPNPFRRVSGFPTTGEENSIVWAYLPRECTIRIYTSSGELLRTIKHQSDAVGQEVWNQLTDARQIVAPGIYFWTVESAVGNARGSLLIIK